LKFVRVGFALMGLTIGLTMGLQMGSAWAEDDASSSASPSASSSEPLPASSSALMPKSPPIPDQLGEIFGDHPQVQSARQNACEAAYTVLYGKAAYYPQLNASISGGNKLMDETTRSDEYGGRNSPEYDGKGINATITLRQHLYDWGRTDATVAGAKSDHAAARLRTDLTLNQKMVEFFELALQFVMQDRLVSNFAIGRDVMQKDLEAVEAHYKSGTARLSTLRQANIYKLDIDAQLSLAERQRDITRRTLKTNFMMEADAVHAAVMHFRARRPSRCARRCVPRQSAPRRSARASKRHSVGGACANGRRGGRRGHGSG
jgi:outer membrane protein TolC